MIEYRDEWANGRESRYQTAAELRARLAAGLVQVCQMRQAEESWRDLLLYGHGVRPGEHRTRMSYRSVWVYRTGERCRHCGEIVA